MKKHFVVQIIGIIILLFISSCSPISKYPLSDSSQKQYDDRLTGLWMLNNNSDKVYLHIGKSMDGGTQIIGVGHEIDLSIDVSIYTMYPTVIDERYFANIQVLDESGKNIDENGGYYLLTYSLTDDKKVLSVAFMNSELVKKSIKYGELVGVISDIQKITDYSENIINFIKSKHLEKLFSNIMIFRKVDDWIKELYPIVLDWPPEVLGGRFHIAYLILKQWFHVFNFFLH